MIVELGGMHIADKWDNACLPFCYWVPTSVL